MIWKLQNFATYLVFRRSQVSQGVAKSRMALGIELASFIKRNHWINSESFFQYFLSQHPKTIFKVGVSALKEFEHSMCLEYFHLQ